MATMIVDEPRLKVQREPRQLRKRTTWLTTDKGLTKVDCVVVDVSPGGAKVMTDAAFDVRDCFEVALVPEHAKRQSCEVVWRRGKTYGVKFVS
jgi:PilZ domain